MLVKFKNTFGEVSLNGFKDKFLFPINRYNGSGKSSNGDIYKFGVYDNNLLNLFVNQIPRRKVQSLNKVKK